MRTATHWNIYFNPSTQKLQWFNRHFLTPVRCYWNKSNNVRLVSIFGEHFELHVWVWQTKLNVRTNAHTQLCHKTLLWMPTHWMMNDKNRYYRKCMKCWMNKPNREKKTQNKTKNQQWRTTEKNDAYLIRVLTTATKSHSTIYYIDTFI